VRLFKIISYILIYMLTQKTRQAVQPPPKIRAEILVDGFVPSKEPQDRFDIAPNYKGVVDYLKGKGFRVEGCTDYTGQEFNGGDLSGIPRNSCQFDVYADAADPLQAKLAKVLKILTDVLNFRANAVFRKDEKISEYASRIRTAYFSYERPDPEAAVEFLRLAESAESIRVEYRYSGENGSFGI
jgi:hypothetical protein